MQIADKRGHAVTAASAEAVAALDATLTAYCGFELTTGDRLKETLAADPDMPLAHCTKGYFLQLFAKRDMAERSKKALVDAQSAAAAAEVTAREAAHLAALAAWCVGDLRQTVAILDGLLFEHPRDLLALKMAHYLNFYLGDSRELRSSLARASYAWDQAVPGYGFFQGLRAFAFEESGDYVSAEAAGRQAIEINPKDIWACHAVAHVMEMQARHREGIAWITGLEDQYGEVNNFAYHLWWHRCLYFLELGDIESVLDHYDSKVRADLSEDTLDMTNGMALLWRLEERGVAVGDRWAELAEKAEKLTGDQVMIFNDAHYALALAAGGRDAGLETLTANLENFARAGKGSEAPVAGAIGLPLAVAARAHRAGDYAAAVEALLPHRSDLIRLGGSHAQRDVFIRLLIDAALKADRLPVARALLAERAAQCPNSIWGWRKTAEVLTAAGDSDGAAAARAQAEQLMAG